MLEKKKQDISVLMPNRHACFFDQDAFFKVFEFSNLHKNVIAQEILQKSIKMVENPIAALNLLESDKIHYNKDKLMQTDFIERNEQRIQELYKSLDELVKLVLLSKKF